jgi:polyhydroxyalkanoate synthesis regulator phasin
MADNVIKRLVDAGVEFTGVSQSKAEALVRRLVRDGEVRRKDAEATISTLVGKGKDTAEAIVVSVQREIGARLDQLSSRVDEVEHRVEELVSSLVARTSGGPGPASAPVDPPAPTPAPAKQAPVKKAAAKKAPAKKAAAKKAPVKKAAAKKAPVKKAAAKKAPASRTRTAATTGPSGVRRVSTGGR